MSADSSRSYESFFVAATADQTPFEYQRRLAQGEDSQGGCVSRFIDVPTGCGKTAAVVLAWLWNRVVHPDAAHRADWPRRLVYCLPMRTLVEQTHRAVDGWLKGAGCTGRVGLQFLMGGERSGEWDTHPERDTILVGTQDMLLSRALNRGYGVSRYRWPIHFGLLNSDCLWVMDETQLMGVGVETSAQLDGLRTRLGTRGPAACWWMSATLDRTRLGTVDHPEPSGGWPVVILPDADREGAVRDRWEARKTLAPAGSLRLDSTSEAEVKRYARELARFVTERHVAGTLTLVVVNRVDRAQAVYELLANKPPVNAEVALVHSRFRPLDRAEHERVLFGDGDRIVIATQAVEAGVDVSARTLITELAPWASLVQRFGRCNRYGEYKSEDGGADIFWLDLAVKDDKDAAPYTAAELKNARDLLQDGRVSVGPRDLAAAPRAPEPSVIRPVLRRKDLLDLFDTTADLLGNDLDISRYVRDSEDADAQVFWRALSPGADPDADTPRPKREELCRVGVVALADFVKKTKATLRAFVWNALDGEWQRLGRVRAGLVVLLDARSGGYSSKLGWTGKAGDQPVPTPSAPADTDEPEEDYKGDPASARRGPWIKLAEHTANVVGKLEYLLTALGMEDDPRAPALRTAALWHDVGKAHEVFQEMLTRGLEDDAPQRRELQAKSDHQFRRYPRREGERSPFRHELASALAWLAAGPLDAPDRDLIAYVIAAHHGKVRLSIRSLPDEQGPRDHPDRLFARGVWDGDVLPGKPFTTVTLDGLILERQELDLGYMRMGENEKRGPSWLARTLALRDDPALGPFRLAFLETLLRVADWRASADETVRLS